VAFACSLPLAFGTSHSAYVRGLVGRNTSALVETGSTRSGQTGSQAALGRAALLEGGQFLDFRRVLFAIWGLNLWFQKCEVNDVQGELHAHKKKLMAEPAAFEKKVTYNED